MPAVILNTLENDRHPVVLQVRTCFEEVEEDPTLLHREIGSSATFLIGATTQYGRAVRFNNRLLH